MLLVVAALACAAFAPALASAQAPAAAGPFDRLQFREIGPASAGGRIDDFAVLESNPSVFYVATSTGSVWKTVNAGTTFTVVFDRESTSSVGDIAIAPADANVVWVGTGENNNRQSSSWGDGVFKSTDGGATWTNMGLKTSQQIARIVVDPVDSDVVYVAALGGLWGPGGDRGVFKTTDGGLTWAQVLKTDADTGATELVMDPANNKVLYAATYQRRRAAWGMNGGGPGSGIWKSTDAGRTWQALTKGIPDGPKGRIGLDVYRRNPNVLYARIEHEKESGTYRSDDAGLSWRKVSATNPRPMYFSQIRVDPNDDKRVYVLGVQLHVSDDGGRTFSNDGARFIHVDFHAMWINPANTDHLLLGGDGGVGISHDRSKTYVWLNNMPIGQFYHVAYDMQTPYTVCGGLQDNNTWCGPSAVRNRDGSANDDWFITGGGDGFVGLVDPSNPRIMYAESQDGRMNRVDRVTNERKTIRPEPPEGEAAYRWNWDTPMALSPHDPATLFVAANRLFRSKDRGHAWEVISPDLTASIDRDARELMGTKGKDVKIARNDGVSAFSTIVSFAESPRRAGLYYTGSDDGVVSVSRDAGATWTRIDERIAGLPKELWVSEVVPSRFSDGTVYVTFDGHRSNDFGTYVYASTDFGASWKSIASSLPKGEVVRTLTEDLKNADVLYLGTETGLFATTTRGASWVRVRANLPTVPVYEITLHPRDNDMILATHGRSLWILDDLGPFQEHAKATAADTYLVTPGSVMQRLPSNERMRDFEGDRRFLGKNPPIGAVVTYHLKAAAKELVVKIADATGAAVRELTGDAVKDAKAAGFNSVVWDLRVAPLVAPRPPAGAAAGGGGGGGGFGGGGLQGPQVLPGRYTVTLVVDGKDAASAAIDVRPDAEIDVSDADRKTVFDTAMALHALQRRANEAYAVALTLHEQLETIKTRMRAGKPSDALKKAVDDYDKELAKVRPLFGINVGTPDFSAGVPAGFQQNVRNRIGGLKGQVMASSSLPTATQSRQRDDVAKAVDKAVSELNAVVAKAPALYAQVGAANFFLEPPAPAK